MGCDGIFDQLSNAEVISSAWLTTKESVKSKNVHMQSGIAVDMIIKTSLVRRTLDNVTCVMVTFSNLEKIFKSEIENIEQGVSAMNINNGINNGTANYYQSNNNTHNNYTNEDKNNHQNSLHQKYESYSGTLNSNSNHNSNKNSNHTNNSSINNNGNTPTSNGIYSNYSNINNLSNNFTSNSHNHTPTSNTSANLEMYRKDFDTQYPSGIHQTRKNYMQKKLVSLDLTSNTKKPGHLSTISGSGLNKSDKIDNWQNSKNSAYYSNYNNTPNHISNNYNSNLNSPSHMFEYTNQAQAQAQAQGHGNGNGNAHINGHFSHPSTTKNSQSKNGLITMIKKTPSAKGIGDNK